MDINNSSKPVEIYLTRHGKTMFNTVERVQGWCDTPLTSEGVEIVEYLGKALVDTPFVAAYTSDSGRTYETAEIILKNSNQSHININRKKGLREVCFGDFEGELDSIFWGKISEKINLSVEEFSKKPDMELLLKTNKEMDSGGLAECLDDLIGRAKPELDRIAKEVSKAGGGKVLLVSHGVTIHALLLEIAKEFPCDVAAMLENAGVSKIIYESGKYKIESVNDTSYIELGKNK